MSFQVPGSKHNLLYRAAESPADFPSELSSCSPTPWEPSPDWKNWAKKRVYSKGTGFGMCKINKGLERSIKISLPKSLPTWSSSVHSESGQVSSQEGWQHHFHAGKLHPHLACGVKWVWDQTPLPEALFKPLLVAAQLCVKRCKSRKEK